MHCWSFTTTKTMLVTTLSRAGTLFHNSLRLPFGSSALRRGSMIWKERGEIVSLVGAVDEGCEFVELQCSNVLETVREI